MEEKYPKPASRRLRIFSFDPALAARYDLAGMSSVTIEIPWEGDLLPGPVGEYIEVVDVDVASGAAYPPVNLNVPELLATDGLMPSESDPRFHQQMVYAVAMKTIQHFERALGRRALWSTHRQGRQANYARNYVPRLRIYPHAFRQKNAYYSPDKKALLFGYFSSDVNDGKNVPGSTVFTCLSHDIIAHETTHALLDGVHPRFSEPVNPDVLAFHEAFADIVALFQHFSYPGVLRDQIARTRGDLARESLLGQLAQQFALASGRGDALRSYLGEKDKAGVWREKTPDPSALSRTDEPHDRGAVLVAAVFGAFMKVYRRRTRDLFRIATDGTGVLRQGDIHPDLVGRLAEEAETCADRALQMCIRAIDYCPPVGITFADYLRAIVTADYDINPADPQNWRLAFIESFREWGIRRRGVGSLAEDSLLWPTQEEVSSEYEKLVARGGRKAVPDVHAASKQDVTRIFRTEAPQVVDEASPSKAAQRARGGGDTASQRNVLASDGKVAGRREIWLEADKQAAMFHAWLASENLTILVDVLGLVVDIRDRPATISANRKTGRARIEVHSLRTAQKRGPLGWSEPHLVAVVTQWRAGFFDTGTQADMERPGAWDGVTCDFKYRAGCTLLLDPVNMEIRRIIRTPADVADKAEFERLRKYLLTGLSPPNAFAGPEQRLAAGAEPFGLLHAHMEGGSW